MDQHKIYAQHFKITRTNLLYVFQCVSALVWCVFFSVALNMQKCGKFKYWHTNNNRHTSLYIAILFGPAFGGYIISACKHTYSHQRNQFGVYNTQPMNNNNFELLHAYDGQTNAILCITYTQNTLIITLCYECVLLTWTMPPKKNRLGIGYLPPQSVKFACKLTLKKTNRPTEFLHTKFQTICLKHSTKNHVDCMIKPHVLDNLMYGT